MRIRIGTRGSALARWQAEHVKGRLELAGHEVVLHFISTTGDRTPGALERVGGKAAFLKEIEEALLAGEVDLAVHSLKDVPTSLPPGLVLCAVLERADPCDVLVTAGARLVELAAGARVGTSSLRRQALLRDLRPDLDVVDLRGNVDTRLRRRREGDFEAIVLAMAGLTRLGREAEATERLDPERFVPAPGQGAIGLEARDGDPPIREAVEALHHGPSARAVTAERSFLQALGGGCNVPLGAFARHVGSRLRLVAFVADSDGAGLLRGEGEGEDAETLGRSVAEALRARGRRAARAEEQPLSGRAVVITRRSDQGQRLRDHLLARGARVLELPGIEVRGPSDQAPLDAALRVLPSFDWVVFTSANAVKAVAERLASLRLPGDFAVPPPAVAVVGPATARAVGEAFPRSAVAIVPESETRAAGLLEVFLRQGVGGRRLLLPSSSRARGELVDGLRAAGAEVVAVEAYQTASPPELPRLLEQCLAAGPDLFVFASPSAVENLVSLAGRRLRGRAAVVIGPTTEEAARAAGFDVRAVASETSTAGLAAAVDMAFGLPGGLTPRP